VALDERLRAVLEIEGIWRSQGFTKRDIVRQRLGISISQYYRLLGKAVQDEEAARFAPLVVMRLRRKRRERLRRLLEGDGIGSRRVR